MTKSLQEPVRSHLRTKFSSHLAHLSILDPKKFHNFLILFWFFRIYYSSGRYFCFLFATSSSRAERAWNFFASCACKHIRPQKISDFFEVFFSNLLFIGRFCGGQNWSIYSKSGLGPNLSGFETWGTKCMRKNLEGPILYFVGTWGTKNILFS